MKKLLLALALFTSISLFAQTKDIKITLVKPAVGFNIVSGTVFDVEYIITNNGTVPTIVSDSMIVLYIFNNVMQTAIGGQSPVVYTNRVMAANDTIWRKYKLNLTITGAPASTPFNFCARVYAQNGNVTIDPDQNNNTACNLTTVPVSEIAKAAASVEVYPNPTSSVLNVSIDYNLAKKISIIDISGKIIDKIAITDKNTAINVSEYNHGIYFYQIYDLSGNLIKSGKFTVSK